MRAVLLILLACTLFVGCNKENPNIPALKTALQESLEISESTKAFPADSIISVRERLNKAKDDVRWLGIAASVEFVRTDAPIIGKLSEASRFLKDAPSRLSGLKKESDRCMSQISGLIAIIETNATNDANGDTINDAYINENAARELEAVESLKRTYIDTERFFRLGLEIDSVHWSSIDSLITAKRGEYSRNIAGE